MDKIEDEKIKRFLSDIYKYATRITSENTKHKEPINISKDFLSSL